MHMLRRDDPWSRNSERYISVVYPGVIYGKTRDAISFFVFVQGRRFLMVASTGVLWLRDTLSLVLL